MNILYFDTETTGLPAKAEVPANSPLQPHITQLGFICEIAGEVTQEYDQYIKPDNWRIHADSGNGISAKSTELTHITFEMCEELGVPIGDALDAFMDAVDSVDVLVAHNIAFDAKLVGFEYARFFPERSPRDVLAKRPLLCTMKAATPICKIPKKDKKTGFKWPKLEEAYPFFFGEPLEGAHSAIVDIRATRRVFRKLVELGAFDEDIKHCIKQGYLPADTIIHY